MTPTEFLSTLRPTLRFQHFTTRQCAVLAIGAEAVQPISMIAVSQNFMVSKPAIFRSMDVLQGRGFIERIYGCEEDFDPRRVFISLTEQGREFLAKMGIV